MPAEGDTTKYSFCTLCCTCVVQSLLLVMIALLLAYAALDPVRVTVRDASLARLAPLNGNGTLAYDLSLAVAVLNPNWAMRAVHATPLEADVLFAGRRFCGARLVDAALVGPENSEEIRMRAAGETAGSAAEVLGSDGVAELVKETVAGQLESLELKLSGKVRYRPPVHVGTYRLDVTCPLRLPAPGTTNGNVVVLDRVIKCHH